MRSVIRSLGATLLALLAAVVLAVSWTATTAVQLAATALIMGGTEHPLSTPPEDPLTYINPYLHNVIDGFINPAAAAPTGTGNAPIGAVGAGDDVYAVITPEEFFPVNGSKKFDESVAIGLANLTQCIRGGGCAYNTNALVNPTPPALPPVPGEATDIFGYSQSAVIAALAKRAAIDDPGDPPLDLSFFLLADPVRPNGGFLARGPKGLTIPLLGVTFYGAAPTNSCEVGDCMETVDLVVQYDGFGGDAAVGLTNLLAVMNAGLGFYFLHGELQNANFADARYQGSYGDTDYYLVPTPRLPVLMPFDPIVPSPILTALDAPLRAAIEAGYARTVNPGVPTRVELRPFRNPIQAVVNIVVAIPTGIDDAAAEATGNPAFRPLGTKPVTSPFGVGGPELPDPPTDTDLSALALSADAADAEPDDTAVVRGAHTSARAQDDDGVIADGRKDEDDTGDTSEAEPDDAGAEHSDQTAGAPDPTRQPGPQSIPGADGDETPDGQPDSDTDDAGGQAAA